MVSPSGDQQDVDQLFSLFRHRPGDVEGRVPQPRPIWGQSVHQHCWHLITLLYLNWEKAQMSFKCSFHVGCCNQTEKRMYPRKSDRDLATINKL